MEMGEMIKQLRIEKGMTLEQLGDRVGVGKSTVRKWENGTIANMRRDKIAKIADALSVSPGFLMGWETATGEPTKKRMERAVMCDYTDEEKELVKMYRELSEDERGDIYADIERKYSRTKGRRES